MRCAKSKRKAKMNLNNVESFTIRQRQHAGAYDTDRLKRAGRDLTPLPTWRDVRQWLLLVGGSAIGALLDPISSN
jgi:hypothetical protein